MSAISVDKINFIKGALVQCLQGNEQQKEGEAAITAAKNGNIVSSILRGFANQIRFVFRSISCKRS